VQDVLPGQHRAAQRGLPQRVPGAVAVGDVQPHGSYRSHTSTISPGADIEQDRQAGLIDQTSLIYCVGVQSAPPGFLRLAGHPVRWRLLTELARCRELLAGTGLALHPGLGPGPPAARRIRTRVLFLCTGNSARSQLAGGAVEAASAGSRRQGSKPLHPEAVRVMREHGIDISGCRSKHLEEFGGQRFGYVITLCDRVREVCPEFPGQPQLIHWSIADPAGEADPRAAFRRVAAELRTRIAFQLARLGE
jgi:protein-tyrosine-phosphatase